MKAEIKKGRDLDGSAVWELVVTAETNYESESLRWWNEQNQKNQGFFQTTLVCEYPHNPKQPSAVQRVCNEVYNLKNKAVSNDQTK